MIFLLLSCATRIDFNIKSRKEEISKAISEENGWILNNVSYQEAHEENEEHLIPIEEAIDKEKIEAINILLKEVSFDDIKRVVRKSVERNSVKVYKVLKEHETELLPFCLKLAKELKNNEALAKILEIMEATELEREILLGTKESVKQILGKELKEGNESIIAVSEEKIFEIIKRRANRKVFLECVRLGYKEKALKLVDKVEIKERTKTGWTALMYAAEYNYEKLVEKIVEKVGEEYIRASNQKGWTAFMSASFNGHEGVVSLLLKAGAKVDEKNGIGSTALYIASQNGHEGVVSLLLKAGAKIDEKDEDGWTALMVASENGHEGVVSVMLKAGAKVNSIIKTGFEKGKSALMYASENGHERVVELLLKAKAKINASILLGDQKSKTSFILAIENGHTKVVKLLLEAGVNPNAMLTDGFASGKTPLMIASERGNEEIVKLLLESRAEVNTLAEGIHQRGMTSLMLASKSGDKGTVSLLLQAGALVNHQDTMSRTPLIQAAYYGHKEVVSLLLEAGADINMADARGAHCLVWATFKDYEQKFETIEFLLSKGANPKVVVEFNGSFYNFLASLNIRHTFKLLDLGLINIHDLDDNQMTNFYNILKNLEGEQNLSRYKMLLITLLTRYSAYRLF